MAKKKTATAAHSKKETATQGVKRKSPKAKKELRSVTITGGVAYLGLPYNVGQTVEMEKKQAQEVVDANRGKYVD